MTGIEVPNLYRFILAPGRQQLAIRRECQRPSSLLVAGQTEQLITLALPPKVAPFEAAEVQRLPEVVRLECLVGTVDICCVKILAGGQLVRARLGHALFGAAPLPEDAGQPEKKRDRD